MVRVETPPRPTQQRIIVLGDELVAGCGDPRRLGWLGRVMARTPEQITQHVLALARPGDTIQALSQRYLSEAVPRLGRGAVDNRIIIGIGDADARRGVSSARSRLHLASTLDAAAKASARCFVLGPPPLKDCDEGALECLSKACAEVCQRRQVPYVDAFTPLLRHDQWLTDLQAAPERWPGQAGYGLLAWLVLHRGWVDWLAV